MAKYQGEFTELQAIVSKLSYSGEWTNNGNEKVFRSADGAILRWWISTGTLQFQGQIEARTKLEEDISKALLDNAPMSAVSTANSTNPSQGNPASSVDGRTTLVSTESKRVFVVHGHDSTAREQLELVLHRLDLDPFVLANTSGNGLTIIEALENEIHSSSTTVNRFGIVLLTPDDVGNKQGEDPEPRARQNVVMEMGMLIAAFGRQNVAILRKGHVVVPSDASGIIYIPFNNHVKETVPRLCQRLIQAGFELAPELITRASA